MVRRRLDRRGHGRIGAADVLQEAYPDVARRFPEYAAAPAVPFYVWLRARTGQRLIDRPRRDLGAKMRDAAQDVALDRGALPQASSASLAQQPLAGPTAPAQAAVWAERPLQLQAALIGRDPSRRPAGEDRGGVRRWPSTKTSPRR
jgi:RNA polymerase sigma-70 factor (ECF subfamily)